MHTKSFSLFDISANNKLAFSINRRALNQDWFFFQYLKKILTNILRFAFQIIRKINKHLNFPWLCFMNMDIVFLSILCCSFQQKFFQRVHFSKEHSCYWSCASRFFDIFRIINWYLGFSGCWLGIWDHFFILNLRHINHDVVNLF